MRPSMNKVAHEKEGDVTVIAIFLHRIKRACYKLEMVTVYAYWNSKSGYCRATALSAAW